MATTTQTNPKSAKPKKEPVAMVTRITDNMKRAAISGKLSSAELEQLSNLATALKTFVTAP